jgi:transcriptional regulator with XRE-family HTH domain
MEKLANLLRQKRMTRTAFAAHIGVGQGYLSDIMNGKATPSLVVAARIEAATGGAVKCIDMVDPAMIATIGRIE